jgi:hypothetical protein
VLCKRGPESLQSRRRVGFGRPWRLHNIFVSGQLCSCQVRSFLQPGSAQGKPNPFLEQAFNNSWQKIVDYIPPKSPTLDLM